MAGVRCLLHWHCKIKRWSLYVVRMFCTWGALSWWACSAYFIHTWFMLSEWNAFGGMYKLGWCGKGIWIVPNRVAMLDAWNCSSVRLRAYYKDDIICCTAYKQELMLLFFFLALLWVQQNSRLPFLSVLILWGCDNDWDEIRHWMILIHWQISQCREEENACCQP